MKEKQLLDIVNHWVNPTSMPLDPFMEAEAAVQIKKLISEQEHRPFNDMTIFEDEVNKWASGSITDKEFLFWTMLFVDSLHKPPANKED